MDTTPAAHNARDRFLSHPGGGETLHSAVQNPRTAAETHRRPMLPDRCAGLRVCFTQMAGLRRGTAGVVIPTSKTGKSRPLPLAQAAIDIIAACALRPLSFLLPNPSTRSRSRTSSTPGKRRGIWRVSTIFGSHDLRHSAASFMINAGLDLYAVARCWDMPTTNRPNGNSHLFHDRLLASCRSWSQAAQRRMGRS